MSVINRMLVDLERRDAPPARRTDAPAAHVRGRVRSLRRAAERGLPVALATALVVVAVSLWLQRGPALVEALRTAGEPAPAGHPRRAAGTHPGDDATPRPGARTTADAHAREAVQGAAVRLSGLRFATADGQTTLSLSMSAPLSTPPRLSRSGDRLALRIAADAPAVALPAPPPGQAVFRALSVEAGPAGDTLLHLQVAPDARFHIERHDQVVALVGRRPDQPATARRAESPAPVTDHAAAPQDAATPTASSAPSGASQPTRGTPSSTASASTAPSKGGAAHATRVDKPASTAASAKTAPRTAGAQRAPEKAVPAKAPAGAAEPAVRKTDRAAPAVLARRRYNDARDEVHAGHLAQARQSLRSTLELDPTLHPAREMLAGLLRRTGDDAAARDVLAEGVRLAPSRPGFAMPYARLLVDAGRLARAAAVLKPAAGAAAADPEYHALAAAIAQRRGRHGQAVTEYTRALKIEARHGRWWLGLGISLAATGHSAEARTAFREARAVGDLTSRLDAWAADRIEALAESGQKEPGH